MSEDVFLRELNRRYCRYALGMLEAVVDAIPTTAFERFAAIDVNLPHDDYRQACDQLGADIAEEVAAAPIADAASEGAGRTSGGVKVERSEGA